MFFRFPPDARWSEQRAAVEFGIGIGEYEGIVRMSTEPAEGPGFVLSHEPTIPSDIGDKDSRKPALNLHSRRSTPHRGDPNGRIG
jgi:hypothetical protein